MPTINSILNQEASKPEGAVLLFAEGLFYKAYEESAYYLHKRYGLKPTVRHYKNVGRTVVSVGFPTRSIGRYLPGAVEEGGQAIARMEDTEREGYEAWKAEVGGAAAAAESAGGVENRVAKALREFRIEEASPIDCMMLVIRLKGALDGHV